MANEVFISYARPDSKKIQPLLACLKSAGIDPWVDKDKIEGGSSYPGKITEAIQGCKAVIVVLSKLSVRSQNVADELALARQEQKRIVPVEIEQVVLSNDLSLLLARIQRIPMHGDAGDRSAEILQSLQTVGIAVRIPGGPKPPEDPEQKAGRAKSGSTQPRRVRRPNPYNFASAARDEMFKGRSTEIDSLLNAIESGVHVAVYGLQRIGKTSFVEEAVLNRAARGGLEEKLLFAKVDLQKLGSEDVKYGHFFRAVVAALADAQLGTGARTDVYAAADAYLDEAARRAQSDQASFFDACEGILEKLMSRAGHRTVLFLDEFSELCRAVERNRQAAHDASLRGDRQHVFGMYVDEPLMRWLSSVLKNDRLRDKLSVVIAVRPFVAEYDHVRDVQILKLTKPIMLYYLDEPSARSLITAPMHGVLSYEEEAVDYLYRLTAGHPYLIQFMLKEIVDKVHNEGRGFVRKNDVCALEELMISEGGAFEGQFNVLDSDFSMDEVMSASRVGIGRATLSAISQIGSTTPGGWVNTEEILATTAARYDLSREETMHVLYQLLNAKVIVDSGEAAVHGYRIAVPLLRKRYVKQNMHFRHLYGVRS